MIYLGLDISTSCVGVTVLKDDGSKYGKILEITHITPKAEKKLDKDEILFRKAESFKEEFMARFQKYDISKVIIEEPLLKSNNINTVSTLLRFNGMISLIIYELLGIKANYISSYDARKYSFPLYLMDIRKINKKGEEYEAKKILKSIKDNNFTLFGNYEWDVDKKLVLQKLIANEFPDIEWERNKKGDFCKENFDASDSYIAVLGYKNKINYGELNIIASDVNYNKETNTIEYNLNFWGETYDKKIQLKAKS